MRGGTLQGRSREGGAEEERLDTLVFSFATGELATPLLASCFLAIVCSRTL